MGKVVELLDAPIAPPGLYISFAMLAVLRPLERNSLSIDHSVP